MTVENLIKSAISDEVNKAMNPAFVIEVVNKKIERSVDKIYNMLHSEKLMDFLINRAIISYLKSYEGQQLVVNAIKNSIKVSIN